MNDGGPAFPFGIHDLYGSDGSAIQQGFYERGMSLRDWFAGHALTGFIIATMGTVENMQAIRSSGKERGRSITQETAVACREYADSLIAELAKERS